MRAAVLAALLSLATPAVAQERFVDTELLTARDWQVFRTLDRQDNSQFCFTRTTNNQGTAFILGGFADRTFELAITDSDWNLSGSIDFFIVIDNSSWTLTGTGDGTSLSIELSGRDSTGDFLNELTAGITLRMLDGNEAEVGRFSLRGSNQAILRMLDCWEEVIAKGTVQEPIERVEPQQNNGGSAPLGGGSSQTPVQPQAGTIGDPYRHRPIPDSMR